MKNSDLENFDLDVVSVLRDFEEDDVNSFIYIRGCMHEVTTGFYHYNGADESIHNAIFAAMSDDKVLA